MNKHKHARKSSIRTPSSAVTKKDSRPTIGYLVRSIHTTTSMAIWLGAVDEARKQNANLICVVGEKLGVSAGSMLYDLISEETVNAVMSWASSDQDETIRFYDRYQTIPLVTLTLPVEDHPAVIMDSYQGMREIMTHLVEAHGYRRIAFIRGPEHHVYARERYQGYLDALEASGLPLEPNLVTPPLGWGFSSGEQAVQGFFEQYCLQVPQDIEAIVATNDRQAIGALQALQRKGFRIPEDIAVTGFNDSIEARCTTPTITSASMPFYTQGQRAVELLMAMLRGTEVPERVALPATIVIHQSCGCIEPTISQAKITLPPSLETSSPGGMDFETAFAQQRPALLRAIAEYSLPIAPHRIDSLIDVFVTDIASNSAAGRFLRAFATMLAEVSQGESNILLWQNVISSLREHVLACLDSPATVVQAENLCGQARIMIGETAHQKEIYRQWQSVLQAEMLREVNQLLMTTFHVEGVIEALSEKLPHLKIPGCYLALYEHPRPYTYPQQAPEWSRLILAYHESRRTELEPGGRRFSSHQLMPPRILPQEQSCTLVVEPLYFREEQIGFILFEVGPRDGVIYETLRLDISSALKGALLMQQIQEHSAQLAREQYILDTFMANVPDRIYFKDLHGRITRANAAHATWLGLEDAAEEIGKTDFDFFSKEEAWLRYEQEQTIIRTGKSFVNQEEQRRLPDGGQIHWSLATKMPLRNERGEIIGTFGISKDITDLKLTQDALQKAYADVERRVEERTRELQQEIAERQRAEIEIRYLQHYLQNIIDSMPSILIGVNIHGQVTHWNRQAERIIGVPISEIEGRAFAEVFPALAEKMEYIQRAIQEGRPHKESNLSHEYKDETHYIDMTIYPLIDHTPQGAVVLVDDVTERVRVEEMMVHAEKMRMIEGLAAGMAHEINNPLGIILQGIQNTSRRLSPDLSGNHKVATALGTQLDVIRAYLEQRNILQYLQGMQDAGERAAQIVANMLNFNRHNPTAMMTIDLNTLLEHTLELAGSDRHLKEYYDFRQIRIVRSYASTLPHVLCIPSEIQQVVLNMLRNAAQAFAEHSQAGAFQPSLHITTDLESDYARIEIADNGPGMDEQTRKRIFEPFYTTKEVGTGTGLGLSVSYFIVVTHHHGRLLVDSLPGKGTTFTILLPLSQRPQEATESEGAWGHHAP